MFHRIKTGKILDLCIAERVDVLLMDVTRLADSTIEKRLELCGKVKEYLPSCKTALLCDEQAYPDLADRVKLFMIHKPSHPLFSLGSCLAQSLLILLHEEYHGQTCKTQRQEPLRMNGISGLRSAVCDCSGCQVVRIHIDHIR